MPDLSADDMRVLRSLEDVWVYLDEIDLPWPRPRLVGRLRALRRQGLVAYRPPDYDVHPVGEWALTAEGDRVAWGVPPPPCSASTC